MQKKILGMSLIATLATALTIACASISSRNITHAMNNMKQAVGTSTEYSVVLQMHAMYDGEIKSFAYNNDKHFANNEGMTEYTLSWDSGNSNQFSIYNGSKFLDANETKNEFKEVDTPVYWTKTDKGIKCNNKDKYIYYNNSSPRFSVYKETEIAKANYSQVFFYTNKQLTNWERDCSGEFAHSCLSNLAYTLPSDGETPVDSSTPTKYTATLIAGTNSSKCTVNNKNGIKVGTSNAGGDMSVKVSKGATKLVLCAAAWKGVSGLSLNISGGTCFPASIPLTADNGISYYSPFMLDGDENRFKFELTINATEETTLKLTSSIAARFVVWNASCE